MTPNKLPPKCLHCKAREPLDAEGFCLDYDACLARQPLGSKRKPNHSAAKPGESQTEVRP